jgi:hypothetical protein
MEEVERIVQRLSERIRNLEIESEALEIRIYNLEMDQHYVQGQLDELWEYKADKD